MRTKTLFILFLLVLFILTFILYQNRTENKNSLHKKIKEYTNLLHDYNFLMDNNRIIPYSIYYINMDKNPERKIFMEEQLSKVTNNSKESNFQRIKGFNGFKINNKEHDIIDGIEFVNGYPEMTKSEIGCTISHLLAIKKAYEDGKDIAIISEDDTAYDLYNILKKELPEIINDAPKDWEVIQLSVGNVKATTSPPDYKYVDFTFGPNRPWGAHSYAINRKGMIKILNKMFIKGIVYFIPFTNEPFPHMGVNDVFMFEVAKTYALSPSIFYPNNSTLESTLHPQDTEQHLKTALEILMNNINMTDLKMNVITALQQIPQNFKIVPGNVNALYNKIIWCFWTGTNEMSNTRFSCLVDFIKKCECNVVLVTKDTIEKYIIKDHPLHEAYQYLSETHKADYLRTYFMNFYGGGYSDIKKTKGSWVSSFDKLINSNNFVCGYPEIEGFSANESLKDKSKDLIGNCAYICKPESSLTKEWYAEMITLLNTKLNLLKKNPAKHPRDKKDDGTGYPLYWEEMLGQIFHKYVYKYKDKISKCLPISVFTNYM